MNKILMYYFLGLVVIVMFGVQLFLQLPDFRVHVEILDVSQGDSILLKTGRGQMILVDSGPGKNILNALKTGLLNRKIDLIIVTHFETDHAEGFLSVLDHYEIGRILISGALRGSRLEKAFFVRAAAKNIPIDFVRSDRDLQIDDELFLDFIFPFSDFRPRHVDSLNNTSVAFRLIYRGRPVLFSGGDMEFTEENEILAKRSDVRAEILKVSHHGSKGSSSEQFLKAVDPHMAAISVGRKNRYGHPHLDTLKRLEERGIGVRRTGLEGTLKFVF